MITPEMAGHNNPPGMIETATHTTKAVNGWLMQNPVVEGEKAAKEIKVYIDRAKLCLEDLESERDNQVRPLNEKVAEINNGYRGSRTLLRAVLDEATRRLEAYIRVETDKREAIAAEARRKAEEAERQAREAERIEREKIENAKVGELDVDIAGASELADKSFEEYKKLERQAAVAERDSKVRVGGGFKRSIGLRNKETLLITDAVAAIKVLGVTDAIKDAILAAAKAYRKLYKTLPPGITSRTEEKR